MRSIYIYDVYICEVYLANVLLIYILPLNLLQMKCVFILFRQSFLAKKGCKSVKFLVNLQF